jgi:hypothetical protein
LEARVETIKAQMQAQLEAEMQDRLGADLQRLAALDKHARKVLVARKHIIDKILTLSCPRCDPGQVFVDIGPLNSLVWYVPSLRYTRCLGWRMLCGAKVTESSTNTQHHFL